MIFDKKYYDDIWEEGVHRHDYCEYASNVIISKYGKCRVLDVGTGCGELVRLLREKGCDAWGTEISDYALKNSCCPGYVVYGNLCDLPFKDDRFDVVFSQGVWEYLNEPEASIAAKEVHRVGKYQMHHIDHDKCDYREEFVSWKSLEWWNEKIKPPKILVACPVHEIKEYAMQEWIDAIKALDYLNYDILLVDNSPNLDFMNRWCDQVPMLHVDIDVPDSEFCQRIAKSMELIRQKFIEGDYESWINIEIDVIIPPEAIKVLRKWTTDCDWVSHVYPARGSGNDEECQSGVGIAMFSRKLMTDFDFKDTNGEGPDAWLWRQVRPSGKYKSAEMWSYFKTKHIGTADLHGAGLHK